MLAYIKKQTSFLYAILVTLIGLGIVLPIAFYVSSEFAIWPLIIIASIFFLATIFITIFYGWLGFLSSLSLLLFFSLMTTTLKFLEVEFTWSLLSAFLFGLVLAINNALFLLEKTRLNLKNDCSLQKSLLTAKDSAFITNLDKDIVAFIIAAAIFLINNKPIATIGSILIVSATLSFVIITLVNHTVLKLFVLLPIVKNSKITLGLSGKIKAYAPQASFKLIKIIRFMSLVTIVAGALIAVILSAIDASGIVAFQSSSVASGLSGKMITNALISLTIALLAVFIYITIRYRWNFALALIITLIHDFGLFLAIFIITRLKLDTLFVASSLALIVVSTTFSINLFKDLKNRVETHVGKVDQAMLIRSINVAIRNARLRVVTTFLFMLLSLVAFIVAGNQNIFTIGALIGFIIAFFSSKLLSPILWVKFELFRLKLVEMRVANNFWQTMGKEEQIVNGINNYNP